jgi:hypothetical protein
MKTVFQILLGVCLIACGLGIAQAEIGAYDADGQFLGYFNGHGYFNWPSGFFNPTLNRTVNPNPFDGEMPGYYPPDPMDPIFFYDNDLCTGIKYISTFYYMSVFEYGDKFYTNADVAPTLNAEVYHTAGPFPGQGCTTCCMYVNPTGPGTFEPRLTNIVPVMEVTLPFDVPIALPVELNPVQDENNKILGCFKKNNGQLRIVDDNSECLASEEPISWY